MANITYQPMQDPRGDWQPQGFLSGFHYQDRLNDYRTQRDIANMSGQLGNRRTLAELNDYNALANVRQLERIAKSGELTSQIALQPDQHKLRSLQMMGDLQAQPYANEFKVWEAMQQLPRAKQQQQLQQLSMASQFLRTVPEGYESQAIPAMEAAGIDVSRWKNDPQRAAVELAYIRNLDIEAVKYISERNSTRTRESNANLRNTEDNQTRIKVAEIMANAQRGSTKAEDDRALREEVQRILSKPPHERTERENATVLVWQVEKGDPFMKQSAAAQGEGAKIESALRAIRPPEQGGGVTQPQLPDPGRKMITVGGQQYEDIGKDAQGRQRIRDPKTGLTGTVK